MEKLDLVYGNTRNLADTLINDIEAIRALTESDDRRFCELELKRNWSKEKVVKRNYEILSKMGKANDMNNIHTLSQIERKLSRANRRRWARYLAEENRDPNMEVLLE